MTGGVTDARAEAIAWISAAVSVARDPIPPVLPLIAPWMRSTVAPPLVELARTPWHPAQLDEYSEGPSGVTGVGVGVPVVVAVVGGPPERAALRGRVPDERTLDHLAGYHGCQPVRVGNGARDQMQLDTAGALMDAAYVYERGGGSLTARGWRRLREVVDNVAATWREPDHGIWEPRAGKRHNVHSKLMSWLALHRGTQLAPLFGEQPARDRWQQAAEALHAELCIRGLDRAGKRFVAAYDHEHPDAALLLLPIHGFLPPSDERVLRTVKWIRDELGEGPYVYRYRADDGIGGEEGAFVLCGFWLAEALAMAGELDEAQQVFVAHAEASNHLGLLSEEIDPATQALLGNFPQAFSHLGLINAAARIDLALRLRDEGSPRVPEVQIER